MRKSLTIITAFLATTLTSCSENYSTGTRIGTVNKFSKSGLVWKSWEGHMNLTQTGMTSTASDFEFSLDNDNEPEGLVKTIDSAMNYGWKVELSYHETMRKNMFKNRGNSNHFITTCKVIDRNFAHILDGGLGRKPTTDTLRIAGMTYLLTPAGTINLTNDSLQRLYLMKGL